MTERPRLTDLEALRASVAASARLPKGLERRRLREAARVSVAELAAIVGVSAPSLARWESGEPVPAVFVVAYAQALDAMRLPEPTELTLEDKAFLREKFANGEGCSHCGGLHVRACPRVRRFSFHQNQLISEVEFWPDGRWPTDDVVFPEQVSEPEDEHG